MQLFDTQARELRQTHVYDGFTLQFIKFETFLQIALCLRRSFALANDLHHFVDVVAGNDESFQNVGAFLRFLQVELGAANGNVVTMFHKVFHALFEREQAWTTLYQCNIVHRERALQLRHLKQFVQHHVGVGVAFHVYHDTHSLSSRLVVGVGDTLQAAFFHQVGNVLDELCLVYAVWYFANHNLIVTFVALYLGLSTQHDTSAPRFVSVFHALQAIDISARGEVGCLDMLHQSLRINFRIVDISTATVQYLGQIVGWHVGSHTHGDTVTTVNE